jgi:hypothetical protein
MATTSEPVQADDIKVEDEKEIVVGTGDASAPILDQPDDAPADSTAMRKRAPSMVEAQVNSHGGAVFLLAITSATVMVVTSLLCDGNCDGYPGWAIACSTISLFITLGWWTMDFLKKPIPAKFPPFASLFLFVWWTLGIVFMSFKSPFRSLSASANGYIACWASWLLAIQIFVENNEQGETAYAKFIGKFTQDKQGARFFHLAAAGVTLAESIVVADEGFYGSGYTTYALCVSGIAVFIVIVLMAGDAKLPPKLTKGLSAFLVVWWIAGWGVMTFKAPFASLDNGWIGSTAALASSLYLYDKSREGGEPNEWQETA